MLKESKSAVDGIASPNDSALSQHSRSPGSQERRPPTPANAESQHGLLPLLPPLPRRRQQRLQNPQKPRTRGLQSQCSRELPWHVQHVQLEAEERPVGSTEDEAVLSSFEDKCRDVAVPAEFVPFLAEAAVS